MIPAAVHTWMSPKAFSRLSVGLAALILLVVLPVLNGMDRDWLPEGLAPYPVPVDFVQYYIGAQVARHGLWNDLYPTPKPEVYGRASVFEPKYKTFLFDPQKAAYDWAFYPPVNLPAASDCSPKLLALVPEAADRFRFIYPPPAAIFFLPLSNFSLDTASHLLWPTLSYSAFFLVIAVSVATLRLLNGGVATYGEGAVVWASLLVVWRGPNSIPDGNISPILAGLISLAAWALLRRRTFLFSLAMIVLVVVKTIGLMWLPLLLDRRFRKVIYQAAAITILLNAVVLATGGSDVYRSFFALLPKIGIPAGEGLVPTLLQLFGFYPKTLYLLLDFAALGGIYYWYWKKRVQGDPSEPANLLAVLAGTMALYCLTNFTVWWHYIPSYLLLPFLGWMVYEWQHARGGCRVFLALGIAASMVAMSLGWRSDDSYATLMHRPSMVVVPLIFMSAAFYRLWLRGLRPVSQRDW